MNITPELAAKVLDADLHNIVKKVSDGGILSPSERQMLQNAAFPESQEKTKRALVLALKYSSGARLTAAELAEVREMHPGFAPEALSADPAAAGSGEPQTPAGPSLSLSPDPSPANGDSRVTRTQLDKWSEQYGTEHRQIRRWIERGLKAGEPCPLDDATKMPAWIDKHLEKKRATLVERVQAAADAANASRPASATAAPPDVTPPAGVPSAPIGPLVPSFDLSSVGGVEGESVTFFRRVFKAVEVQLEAAYKSGVDADIRRLHTRLKDVGESLRKHEKDAESRAIRLGHYIERAEATNDVMQALHTLALMREKRSDRLRAELADVPPEWMERIIQAHDATSRREEDILRSLALLKTPADVSHQLAA